MKDELNFILKKKWFWTGIFLPILITILINIGIIFSIPIQISQLQSFTGFLSQKVSNDYSVQILIGLFTVFVVFFTFAQFSYSNKSIPTYLIRKYIIEADVTVFYLGMQFGFILSLVFFSFINKDIIHRLNLFLNLLYLFISAGLSVVYFFWITTHIQASNVFRLILNHLNIKEIISIEQRCLNSLRNFEKSTSSLKTPFELRYSDPLGLLGTRAIKSMTYKTGIVSDIKLIDLIGLLRPKELNIQLVILDLKIGEFIPKYEPLPDLKPKTVLIKIIPIQKDHIAEELAKFVDEKRLLIEDQFIIEENTSFHTNRLHIRNLIDFYFYAVSIEPKEGEKLIDEMISFLIKETEKAGNNDWNNTVGLTENFYLEFVNVVESNLRKQNLTKGIVEATLSFVYAMKHLVVKNRSVLLMRSLIGLLNILLYNIIISGLQFRYYLSTLVLYIKEVTILSLIDRDLTKDEFLKVQKDFFEPIVFNSIEQATNTYYNLILHFNKIGFEEGKKILLENGNQLIDFLFPLNQWSPIKDIIFEEDGNESNLLEGIVKYHAANLLYLSIFIFMRIERSEIPTELLKSVAFKLTDHCNTIFKHTKSNIEIIDDLFYDYGFNNPSSSFGGQVFETSGIHEYGTYSPSYYGFARFWIAYSFYNHNRMGKFIPQKLPGNEGFDRILLDGILKQLDRFDYQKYTLMLGREYNLEKLVHEYKEHLKNLLGRQ